MSGNFSPLLHRQPGLGLRECAQRRRRSPRAGTPTSGDGIQFPGGMIPKSMIDPNSTIYMKLFPAIRMPNPVTNSTGSNYQYFVGPPQNRWEYRIRGDYNISQNTKLFVSWNRQEEGTIEPDQHLVVRSAVRCRIRPPRHATQKSDV